MIIERKIRMNKKERFLAAINRQPVDKIPYTYCACPEAEKIFRDYLHLIEKEEVWEYFECYPLAGAVSVSDIEILRLA